MRSSTATTRWRRSSRRRSRMPVEVRDAPCRSMEAEPAAGRRLRQRPRLSRRRRGASRHPDRRARHEHRRRRRRRPLVEARRARCRAGAGRSCLPSYEIERRQVGDRNVAASRYASLGRRKWRSDVAAEHPRRHAGGRGDARKTSSRVADVEQRKTQRDDRRRARLPLCRLAAHRDEPGEPEHIISRIPADHVAGRAAAACLARRRHADAGPHRQHGYTLIRLGGSRADSAPSSAPLRRSARRSPLDIPDARPRDIYGYDLLLLRPDLHIVWRGNARRPSRRCSRRSLPVTRIAGGREGSRSSSSARSTRAFML